MDTKRQLIEDAFDMIGLGDYVFDLEPEEFQRALIKLDRMMASWDSLGIRIGYLLPTSQSSSDLTQNSGIPDTANAAVSANLAVTLAPAYGKAVSLDVRLLATSSFRTLQNSLVSIPDMQYPDNLPVGVGNRRATKDQGYFQPSDVLTAGNSDELEF